MSGVPDNGGSAGLDSRQTVAMLDDALRTAREAINDIGQAKALYGEFLAEVERRRGKLELSEQELRQTAHAAGEVLAPAESALQEILSIKRALQDELAELQGRLATTARLQAELEKARERNKQLVQDKAEVETGLAASQRECNQAQRELVNLRARRAAEEGELDALRADTAALREEIEEARADRDRFRDLLGNVRSALDEGGRIDRGNFPDVLEKRS